MLENSFYKNTALAAHLLALAAAAGLMMLGHWPWSLGVLVATFWIFLNFFFLFRLLDMVMNPKGKAKNRILLLSILKFPVLYAAGFFILKSRFFPIYSLLLGLTLFMIVFTFGWFRMNLGSKSLEGRAS